MEGLSWIRSVKDWVGWREVFFCRGSLILKPKRAPLKSPSPLLLLHTRSKLTAHSTINTYRVWIKQGGGMINIRPVSQSLHNCNSLFWAIYMDTRKWRIAGNELKVEKFCSHLHAAFSLFVFRMNHFLGKCDVKVVSAVYVTELRLYLHSIKWFLVSYIALMIKWLAGVN